VEKLVTVASYRDPLKADLDRNRLEAAGIPSSSATTFSGAEAGFATVNLNVAEHDAERARELLASQQDAEPDAGIQTEADESEPLQDLESSEALIERALRASLFGMFICPPLLQFYSLWTIFQVVGRDQALSEKTSIKMYLALALDGLFLVGMAVICAGLLG
jgi:hypothetical protein